VAVDGEGNEMPFEEALAMADAAGVGGGPPEEMEADGDTGGEQDADQY